MKVGDRVKNINYTNYINSLNEVGTVVKMHTWSNESDVIVNFDNDVGGWEDVYLNIKQGHGLYVPEDCLELI